RTTPRKPESRPSHDRAKSPSYAFHIEQLSTPEQLVSEFHGAVMELYFARKRINALEAENTELKARLAAAEENDSTE
ncbi:hypothetical protein ACFYO2_12355, partial [Streptomyces sp. NPDC006602]|uniref:hypothetical protein n=1 Tax=Streptomyces sp. NPDC006602 TaxID=3364751 RepID=UPI0036BDD059